MQFSYEPGVALIGSLVFLAVAMLAIIGIPLSSHNTYKLSMHWHEDTLKHARAWLKKASRRDREAARSNLSWHLEFPPEKPSLTKQTFATIAATFVVYVLVAAVVFGISGARSQTVNADAAQAYEAKFGVVDNLEYEVLQLEPFVSTTTEGRTFLGSGSVNTYPENYVQVVYEYQDNEYTVPVALDDAIVIVQADTASTIEFAIDDRYRVRWANVQREYTECTPVVRWLWLTCDNELVSETVVINSNAPSLSELIATGRISVTLVMSPEQHREVLAGK